MCDIQFFTEDTGVFKSLCFAVVTQAVNDYKYLKENGILSYKTAGCGEFSKTEIKKFLNGEWCDKILSFININLSGSEIMSAIEEDELMEINSRTITAYKDGVLCGVFNDLTSAARFSNLRQTSDISRCLNGKRRTAGGYSWKYM